ncbi:response regulator [Paenibacillus sp. HB172176]|uniref:response regulator transcription factor n=1 Tax=Paenibacillus sp. HB172176 TaxID=2493690 RepID=UPI0014398897|nr:response regulator [Paenibacillus sp. HB172176]
MHKLIIVDDNLRDRKGIAGLLPWKSLGCEVAGIFSNGMEALSATKALRPDIVLTDVQMPLMDGIELGQRVKKEFPAVQLIFMSNYDDFTFTRGALQLEAADYVLKPIRKDELNEVVAKVIGKLVREQTLRRERESLLMQYRESRALEQAGEESTYHEDIVDRIKEIVESRYAETITVQEIAEAVYLSVSHVNKLFKEKTGSNIFEYLTEYRMEKAKEMLRKPDSLIYRVAEESGYVNKSHFCLVFKKHTGFSPSQYKRLFH